MPKEHRIFHYDPDTGRSTPVQEIRLEDGSIALVPVVEKKETTSDSDEQDNQASGRSNTAAD